MAMSIAFDIRKAFVGSGGMLWTLLEYAFLVFVVCSTDTLADSLYVASWGQRFGMNTFIAISIMLDNRLAWMLRIAVFQIGSRTLSAIMQGTHQHRSSIIIS